MCIRDSSWLGREIYAIGVGNLQSATCIVGGTHATEYYGVLGCFRFCEEVLESLKSGTFPYDTPMGKAIGERGLLFVPCLNPDGLEPVSYTHLMSSKSAVGQ